MAQTNADGGSRPQSAGLDDGPCSPLSKFCKDKLTDIDKRLQAAIVHKVDLKEALEVARPTVVSRYPRSASAASLARAVTVDSGLARTFPREHHCLTKNEKDKKFQKAVDYFEKVQQANELAAQIKPGTLKRNSSTPAIVGKETTPKGSKESVARKDSKDKVPAAAPASEEKKDAAASEGQGNARAKFLKALGMPKERKSVLVLTAIKAIESAGEPAADKKRGSTSEIGGSVVMGKNTLLARLKAKRESLATIE